MYLLFFSILFGLTIGFALSIDAFTLSLVYGSTIKKTKEIYFTSFLVGICHFFMPLIGYFIATVILIQSHVYTLIESKLDYFTAAILFLIGILMIIKQEDQKTSKKFNIFSKIMFALSVSIDSLLIGIGFIGIHRVNIFIAFCIFAIVSCTLTFISLYISRKTAKKLNTKNLNFYAGVVMIIISIIILLS